MESIIIRAGTKADLPRVLELINELAAYERAAQEVTNTVEQMGIDGFGKQPLYGMYVAESKKVIVGISVYYYRYSTWKGKRLYLEDIVVRQQERGKGIGKRLFEQTMKKSLEDNCTGMMWQVLEWNEPGIHFYEKYGAKFDREWVNVSLEAEGIRGLLGLGRPGLES
jgi:GNAT superfamily N-acetyltransferase